MGRRPRGRQLNRLHGGERWSERLTPARAGSGPSGVERWDVACPVRATVCMAWLGRARWTLRVEGVSHGSVEGGGSSDVGGVAVGRTAGSEHCGCRRILLMCAYTSDGHGRCMASYCLWRGVCMLRVARRNVTFGRSRWVRDAAVGVGPERRGWSIGGATHGGVVAYTARDLANTQTEGARTWLTSPRRLDAEVVAQCGSECGKHDTIAKGRYAAGPCRAARSGAVSAGWCGACRGRSCGTGGL